MNYWDTASGEATLEPKWCSSAAGPGLHMEVSVLTIDTSIARRLRGETTMSLNWIAQRLGMGSWTYVSNLLGQKPKRPRGQEVLLLCQ